MRVARVLQPRESSSELLDARRWTRRPTETQTTRPRLSRGLPRQASCRGAAAEFVDATQAAAVRPHDVDAVPAYKSDALAVRRPGRQRPRAGQAPFPGSVRTHDIDTRSSALLGIGELGCVGRPVRASRPARSCGAARAASAWREDENVVTRSTRESASSSDEGDPVVYRAVGELAAHEGQLS